MDQKAKIGRLSRPENFVNRENIKCEDHSKELRGVKCLKSGHDPVM